MLRDAGLLCYFYALTSRKLTSRSSVQRFAIDVVEPKVREMDENEAMDPAIIKGLFDQGVSFPFNVSLLFPF